MHRPKERDQADVNRRSLLKRLGIGTLVGSAGMMTQSNALAQATNPYAFWVHGNAARVQFPDRLDRAEYLSTGAVFRGRSGTENWFHLPLSVPVFIRIERPTLFGAHLSLRTAPGVYLREVKLVDGEHEKGITTGLNASGEIFQAIDIVDPAYFLGLGISARIEFSASAQTPEVHIISAGVNLLVQE